MKNNKILNAQCKITPKESMQFNKLLIKTSMSKLELYNMAIEMGLKELQKKYETNSKS